MFFTENNIENEKGNNMERDKVKSLYFKETFGNLVEIISNNYLCPIDDQLLVFFVIFIFYIHFRNKE